MATNWFSGMLPFAAMVTLECVDTGVNMLGKAAMSNGVSHFVLVVYSNALATLIMFSTSFMCTNRTHHPPLTSSILFKFFLLSFAGITITQNCVYKGLSYSSPTLASAIGQLVPAFTFMLAVIFRMEKLDLRSSKGQLKVMGTLVSILGAFIVIFYKGPAVGRLNFSSQPELISYTLLKQKNSWVIGGFFITVSSLSLSLFIIFQAAILQQYPSEMIVVSFYCLFGTIQCAVISLIAEKDPNAWELKSQMELISVIYTAVFGNVVTYGVATWCIHKKGPVFVAMFKPLGIAISVFMSVTFLSETIYFGSIIGAIIIVAGFYGVMWAQSCEGEENELIRAITPMSSTMSTPLLGNQLDFMSNHW